jgi:alpha-glucosidase
MTWWRRSVFYEIYLRSFQDSNGDGIGDLNGVTARLPYLADLGIDALWLTPFYPSPHVDFGYDVADYENVDPQYGTLDDFDRLIAEAHRRGVRIVVDFVLNHSSDQHAWFAASRQSRESAFRDWYIWRDGRNGGPPNNWESTFGGPAWTRDERSGQWYYHCFYAQQPDLNWRNPDVEERMLAAMRFWLERGADGFRLDAVNALFEDPHLTDNPPLPEPLVTLTGVDTQEFKYTRGLPEMHAVLRRVRQFVDRHFPSAMLISEAYLDSPSDLLAFYGRDDEMHLPFNFFLAETPHRDAALFREVISNFERTVGALWPSLVLSNHDIERACDRFRDGADADAVAKVMATLLLTLRGTPFIYYGEEIAMRTDPPTTIAEVQDPVGRTFWPRYKGRDGERRPMPWDNSTQAGFTSGTPWLSISPDARDRNVERQASDGHSVLSYYRALLQLRRSIAALQHGVLRDIHDHAGVLTYTREAGTEMTRVVLNMSTDRKAIPSSPGKQLQWRVALGTHRHAGDAVAQAFELAPLEVVILRPDAS